MKRTPLRAGRRSVGSKHGSLAPFWEEVTGHGRLPCALAYRGGCDGPVDAHHLIEKQHLRDRQVLDPRNGIAVCRFHHGQLHAKRCYLTPEDFPEGFREFAYEARQIWRVPLLTGPR